MLDSPQNTDYQCTSKSCRNVLIQSTNSDFFKIILMPNTFHFNIVRTSPLSLAVSFSVELAVFQASKSALTVIIRSTFLDFFLIQKFVVKSWKFTFIFCIMKTHQWLSIETSQEFSFNFFVELIAISLQCFIWPLAPLASFSLNLVLPLAMLIFELGPRIMSLVFPKITSLNLLTSEYIMVRWMKHW